MCAETKSPFVLLLQIADGSLSFAIVTKAYMADKEAIGKLWAYYQSKVTSQGAP